MKLDTLLTQSADDAFARFTGESQQPIPTWIPQTADKLETLYGVTIDVIEDSLDSLDTFASIHDAACARNQKNKPRTRRFGRKARRATYVSTAVPVDAKHNEKLAAKRAKQKAPSADAKLAAEIASIRATLAALESQLGVASDEVIEAPAKPEPSLPNCSDLTHDECWRLLGADPTFRGRKTARRNGPPSANQVRKLRKLGLAK